MVKPAQKQQLVVRFAVTQLRIMDKVHLWIFTKFKLNCWKLQTKQSRVATQLEGKQLQ